MAARLLYLHSPDAENLETWSPADPSMFSLLVQAMVGWNGTDGHESFGFVVCTPAWLQAELERKHVFFPRHHVLVDFYDYRAIESSIQHIVESARGNTWDAVAERIGRYGRWEFEDYQPYGDEESA